MTAVRLSFGWTLLLASVVPAALPLGSIVIPSMLLPAAILAALSLVFLFLLYPRLGSPYEVRGLINACLVFFTLMVLASHSLANRGDWLLARLWAFLQEAMVRTGASVVGDTAAAILFTPLYALIAFILLISLAYRSPKGFVIILCLVAVNGMVPLNPFLLVSYILWFSGFWLIQEDVLYLPTRLQERVSLGKHEKDMLLELRGGPLDVARALFVLTGGKKTQLSSLNFEEQQRLRLLAATGLVEADGRSQTFFPSASLRDSYLAPGIPGLVSVLGLVASVLLLVPCVLYLLSPVDMLPDPILPPLGFIDDIVLCILGSLPLIANGRQQVREALTAVHEWRHHRLNQEITYRASQNNQEHTDKLQD